MVNVVSAGGSSADGGKGTVIESGTTKDLDREANVERGFPLAIACRCLFYTFPPFAGRITLCVKPNSYFTC